MLFFAACQCPYSAHSVNFSADLYHKFVLFPINFYQSEWEKAERTAKAQPQEWKLLCHDKISGGIRKGLYLIGISYRAQGDFERAAASFKWYLSSGEIEQLPYYEEAQWELVAALFATEGQEQWQALLETSTQQNIVRLVRLYLAKLALTENSDSLRAAFLVLQKFIDEPKIFDALEEKDEILFWFGCIACQLYQKAPDQESDDIQDERYEEIAEQSLSTLAVLFPSSPFAADALFTVGNMHYQQERYENALPVFLELAENYPASHYASEAWFLAAHCAEESQPDEEIPRYFRQQAYTLYPQSSKAGEAYFRTYSFAEYLHGPLEAYQHLHSMPLFFPESPFLIVAKYLTGLDQKDERKTPEGLLLHSRSPQSALLAFKESADLFDLFYEKGALPEEQMNYLIAIRYRSKLEYALLAFSLAEESIGEEKEEQLTASIQHLTSILNDFLQAEHPLISRLLEEDPYPRIQAESQFALSQVYLKKNQEAEAEKMLLSMLENYRSLEISSSYYLSRALYELALLSMRQGNHELALERLILSESAGKNGILAIEQKLDLWIQKSHCYRSLKQINHAMLMLSHVINENASSSLRIKAMLLRADLYKLQGRPELAIKQLEAASRKGGEWAQEAKEKLRNEYGFD